MTVQVTVVGRLGRDAETRDVSGQKVANFPVAGNVGYGDRKQTLWFDCALWGKRAESGLVDYLKKGQQVAVMGEMSEREHEGKVYKQLRVSEVVLCGGQSDGGGQQQSQPASQPAQKSAQGGGTQQASSFNDFSEEIPF